MTVDTNCRMISLSDQVRWLERCLAYMNRANKPESEIALQEACIFTVKERMKGLGLKHE